MIFDLVRDRDLPELMSCEKMKQILLENEYGILPEVDFSVTVSEPKIVEKGYCEGNVEQTVVDFTFESQYASHTFKVSRLLNNDGKKRPFFILLNFSPNVPNQYYPAEEIADNNFNVLSAYYQDISLDNDDFQDGLAKVLLPNGQEDETTCGKIRIWAEAVMRIMDYAETLDCMDCNNASVVGHSRLGKVALLSSMIDSRFKFTFSNDSGCSGSALSRGNTGERISDITQRFPYWFCKKYKNYSTNNFPLEFDQHYILAAIAPRYVYVSSASMDTWADPDSEFLSCVAATPQYEKFGFNGLIYNQNQLPKENEKFHSGKIGYHRRRGTHFLSRNDWKLFIEFINKHKED